jgi:hypothetical protein
LDGNIVGDWWCLSGVGGNSCAVARDEN